MKPLNKTSTRIFDAIVFDLNTSKPHKTIENSKGFMPLHVEKLGTYDAGTMFSFAHYFKQNGDMCQDPEMCFIKTKLGKVYPCMYQQAIPPIYEESIFFDDGWKVRTRQQKEHVTFAQFWLKNIKEQQRL